MDCKELAVKLCVTYPINVKLHVLFRRVEDFVFGESDEPQPLLKIWVINDACEEVVLKEHLTLEQLFDVKQNRTYYMFARKAPEQG